MLQFNQKKRKNTNKTSKPILVAEKNVESTSLCVSEKESISENSLNMMISSITLLETEVDAKPPETESIHEPLSSWEDIDVETLHLCPEKIKSEPSEASWEDMFSDDLEKENTDTYNKKSTDADTTDGYASSDPDADSSCIATTSAPILPSFKKSKASKETKNLKLFSDLSCLKKLAKPTTNRMNHFVMLLGNPDVPRRHPGVDDTYHPDKDIDLEWQDLLERGMTTLKYINHKSRAVRACPNAVFLRPPISVEDDALTKRIHTGHTLDFYRASIQNENQSPIEFHFAGHGNAEKIGAMSSDKRLTPDVMAELFDYIAHSCDLADILKAKKRLIFNFHVCNAAYIDLSDCFTDNDIQTKLLNQSVIGKFYQKMIELGYTNITVIGYRGFYQGMTNGSDSFVTDTIQSSNPDKLNLNINRATHCIKREGEKDVVILPETDLGKRFPVDLEPLRSRQQLERI